MTRGRPRARRSRWRRARLAPIVLALAVGALAPAMAHGAASWRLEQPAPPAGAPFKVPLGAPGDLSFYAPNRGLLSIEGNSTIARGLYFYDGVSWRLLSTVCGGASGSSRIAWAGPDEFWTITAPSLPRIGDGLSLCHFVNGHVVGSYSTPSQSPDPFHAMDSASCNGPNDCWFGGIGTQDPSGTRIGGFHLHWDGTALRTVYAPQGRGVSSITTLGGSFYETTFVGVQREDPLDQPSLLTPEEHPFLIHTITANRFRNAPFLPADRPGLPDAGTELLSDSTNGSDLWFVGGGAASGPSAPTDGGEVSSVPRPPIAVHVNGSFYQELALPDDAFGTTDRFGDVSAVIGDHTAWVTDVPFAQRASTTAKAKVVHLTAQGTIAETDSLPSSGAGRGTAARIACPAPTDCWMVTEAGWLFHYTDGTAYPQTTDPAFATLITTRPNESVAQFVPDTPPADDSSLLAPPPVVATPPATVTTKKLVALLSKSRSKLIVRNHGKLLILQLTMYVHRSGTLQVIAKHGTKVVVRTPVWKIHKGFLRVRFQVQRGKRYPTKLQYKTTDSAAPKGSSGSGSGSDIVLTR